LHEDDDRSLTPEDRCDRAPQLAALERLTKVMGTKIGRWPVAEVTVKIRASPGYIGGRLGRGEPCDGEDNEKWLNSRTFPGQRARNS